MDEPLLHLLRDDLTRRVNGAAETMTDTLRLLTAVRGVAGEGPGAESLRAAIDELTAARDGLLVSSR
ncbi:hypothetical protein [Actinoplanes siamensis]|uniref:Uncharacterized protein n=1 Tax=Actinoplanes siamensis TaxID=1223317 RepID=A0A919NBM3_9ACTN|nr:hypothetical protein [Actinoplanes siamensis]GIF08128.1 hypothetical protein Asi03nite_56660 [Actinoplanes siamensis]